MNLPAPQLFSPPDLTHIVRRYVSLARSHHTRRAYAAQWQAFERWCIAHGCETQPAHPHAVAAYLAGRAEMGASVATIDQAVAAIVFAHKAARLPFDRANPELSLVLAGIRRHHVSEQRQAKPLSPVLLRELLSAPAKSPADHRDRALLTVLYSFALRPSEAAALDWTHLGAGRGWLALGDNVLELVLLGSKAAPGAKQRVAIPAAASPLTAEAIERWIGQARIEPGQPMFRSVTRAGRISPSRLHPGSIGVLVKQVLLRHFLSQGMARSEAVSQAVGYSGHSGRVGFYVTASEAGVPPQHIAAIARHRGLAMARRYSAKADLLVCAPHRHAAVGL